MTLSADFDIMLLLVSVMTDSGYTKRFPNHFLKPGSHRKIGKDYRPDTGKDQEILNESG